MKNTFLITGATGNVAQSLLPHLLDKGITIRALVRDKAKGEKLRAMGIELVEGDLSHHHSLPSAFEGADTVMVIHPAGPRAPEQSSNALWAAKQAGAKRIVRLSAIGAGYDAPTINGRMHGLSDAEIAASGLNYTIVKPHFFFQNMMMAATTISQHGKVYMALDNGKLPMIDVRDIGEFLAKVLLSDDHRNKTYTITGPAAITLHEFAAAVSAEIGKPVDYIHVPMEAAVAGMEGAGMDKWMVSAMVDYMHAYAKNWASEVTDTFASVVGHAPRSVADFARDFAAAFKG